MKRIVLLRHAKSYWEWEVSDQDRPLTPKGMQRISQMAQQPDHPFHSVDRIFSSTANRAIHTAILMLRGANLSMDLLRLDESLYTFSATEVVRYIQSMSEKLSQVILVGHNPAFTETVNRLSDTTVAHLPTAAWAELSFPKEIPWKNIQNGTMRLGIPKQILR